MAIQGLLLDDNFLYRKYKHVAIKVINVIDAI